MKTFRHQRRINRRQQHDGRRRRGPATRERNYCATRSPAGPWLTAALRRKTSCIRVRALAPLRVVVVDATDMGLNPGEIRVVDPHDIAEMFIVSTHTMPLTFLIDSLKDDVPEVTFIGIQPDIGVLLSHYPCGE